MKKAAPQINETASLLLFPPYFRTTFFNYLLFKIGIHLPHVVKLFLIWVLLPLLF
jgi:hypothetical protein